MRHVETEASQDSQVVAGSSFSIKWELQLPYARFGVGGYEAFARQGSSLSSCMIAMDHGTFAVKEAVDGRLDDAI